MHVSETLPNWGAFVALAARDVPAAVAAPSSRKPAADRWDYGTGWDRALSLAAVGWPDGLARVDAIRAEISQHVNRQLTALGWQYDVAGALPDVARYLAGDPENMLNPTAEPAPRRVVRVVVSMSASCKVNADVLYQRGAVAVALVDALETCGTRVDVVVAHCHSASSNPDNLANTRALAVTVKGAEDAADVDRLAFALCHPATLRRLQFAYMETSYDATARARYEIGNHGNYGYTADLPAADRGDVYLPAAKSWEPQWSTPAAAAKWILETLQAQGLITSDTNTRDN